MHFASGKHEIIRLIGLQNQVHALDIILCGSPIALGFEVAEIEQVLETDLDTGDAAGNLAGHERLAADRAFVIEQDAVTREHAVGFTVNSR